MPTFHFEVDLQQPVIVSQQAATAGAHESLDYLPGSLFLGLSASRLYSRLETTDSWRLFHSGQVRFTDALPTQGNQTAWPVPLSWHHFKGDSFREDGRYLAETLFDPALIQSATDRQPVQLRGGYVCLDGTSIVPLRQYFMKTAIDRSSAMAAEGQLFGYQALKSGTTYRFALECDEDVDAALVDQLVTALSGTARLGRSRSAQFGEVVIRAVAPRDEPVGQFGEGDELVLWLLSDLQLLDRGQPALQPLPELLGLPAEAVWLADRSFLRTRRYSAWNAWRRHYDPERQVISRGSVLRYQLAKPLTADQFSLLEAGLGLHIESGLGKVWVNPPLLATSHPPFGKQAQTAAVTVAVVRAPESALVSRLQQRADSRLGEQQWLAQAERLYAGLCDRVRDARVWLAVAPAQPLTGAPGRSQWGRLKDLSNNHRTNSTELMGSLTDSENGLLRGRSGWETPFGPEPDATLGNWLSAQLETLASQQVKVDRVIGHLAVLGLQNSWQACCEGRQGERT